jgi:hypothetical protein
MSPMMLPGVQATGGSSAATRWGRRGTARRAAEDVTQHVVEGARAAGRATRGARQAGGGVGPLRSGTASAQAPTAAASTAQHLLGQPGQNHRREDGQQFLDERPAHARATHRGHLAEPVDDVLLAVAEDVVGDGLTVAIVDRGEVGTAAQQVVLVLAEGLEDRVGAGGVAGVGLQTTQQCRQHGGRCGANVVGGGADLLGDGVGRKGAEDVVECGHGDPFCGGGTAPHVCRQPSRRVAAAWADLG